MLFPLAHLLSTELTAHPFRRTSICLMLATVKSEELHRPGGFRHLIKSDFLQQKKHTDWLRQDVHETLDRVGETLEDQSVMFTTFKARAWQRLNKNERPSINHIAFVASPGAKAANMIPSGTLVLSQSLQMSPAVSSFLSSACRWRRHVFLGRPLFPFPSRSQVKACRVMLLTGLRKVWPIHHQRLCSTGRKVPITSPYKKVFFVCYSLITIARVSLS